MNKDGCVTFNKQSWHYRLANYVFFIGGYKMNLCPYMRMVLCSLFLLPFIAVWRKLPDSIREYAWVVHGELIFLSLVMLVAAIVDFGDTDNIFPSFIVMTGIGFAIGNICGLVGLSVLLGVTKLVDIIENRPYKPHRTRGLIKTYMQSKHDKICPCVEFEDE